MGFKKVLLLSIAGTLCNFRLNAMERMNAIALAAAQVEAATDGASLPELYETYVTALDQEGYYFQIVRAIALSKERQVEHTLATCQYYAKATGKLSPDEARLALLALVKRQE